MLLTWPIIYTNKIHYLLAKRCAFKYSNTDLWPISAEITLLDLRMVKIINKSAHRQSKNFSPRRGNFPNKCPSIKVGIIGVSNLDSILLKQNASLKDMPVRSTKVKPITIIMIG